MAQIDDYQLESMEDQAVKKSQTAKRVLAGVGMAAAGAASAYAYDKIANDTPADTNSDELSVDDMMGGATSGAVTDEGMNAPEEQPAQEVHVHQTYVVNDGPNAHGHHAEHDPEVKFESSEYIVDDEGNIVASVDSGTIDGRAFAVVDEDGDGDGDLLAFDANNNGQFESDEVTRINDGEYIMGNGENQLVYDTTGRLIYSSETGFMAQNQRGEDVFIYDEDDKTIDDIDNDFNDTTGDHYDDDLAQNNDDYKNDDLMEHYGGMEAPRSAGLADDTLASDDFDAPGLVDEEDYASVPEAEPEADDLAFAPTDEADDLSSVPNDFDSSADTFDDGGLV